MIDAKAFGEELAGIVKAATAPLIARLDTLEKRLDDMPVPEDGKDSDPGAVAALVREQIKGDLDALRGAVDGIEVPRAPELPDIPAIVQEAVTEAVKSIPAPRDGKDGAPGERGEKGEPGADGAGVADLLLDIKGHLIATMTDGRVKTLGQVVGKDGASGRDGSDGKDGLGFDDLDFEIKDGRMYAVFRRGDAVKECRIPGISYRGVWKSGEYLTGDSVTFGACQWIATEDTSDKPGEGKGWQLAVRKGRDAKGA